MSESSNISEEVEGHVNTVTSSLPFPDEMLKLIVDETAKDVELQRVIVLLQQGWIKGKFTQYFPELSVRNGLLLPSNRIVILVSMHQDMLHRIREGHRRACKCKRRARQAVYWTGINRYIEELISKCDVCLSHHYKLAKEPMLIG